MKFTAKSPSSCEAMMQEIAEASVESILTGMDTPECQIVTPGTPPTESRSFASGWYSPSATATPFSTQPSWSFSETETMATFRSDYITRQASSSGRMLLGGSISTAAESDDPDSSRCFDLPNKKSPTIPIPPHDGITTVMLRNIPNKYTRSGLLSALVERGFDPTADCNNLYLPMDAGSGCNLGYAFLNFTTHERAVAFMHQFDGVRLPSAGSRKVCSVVWANKQGLFQHSNPPTVKDAMTAAAATAAAAPITAAAALDDDSLPTCKIFVGGLPTSTTEADLVDYFGKFGPIREASIVSNRQTGQSRGFGFCEFLTPDSVDRVQAAQSRRPHSINCRIVSVRPYNLATSSQYTDEQMLSGGPCYDSIQGGGIPSGVTSFLMGHGGSIIRYDSAATDETGFAASSSIHYRPFISY